MPLTGGSDAGHPPSSEKEVGDSLLKDHVDFCIPTSSKDFSEGSDFGTLCRSLGLRKGNPQG